MPVGKWDLQIAMWQPSAERKQLKRTQDTGESPKSERIPLCSPQENLHGNCDGKNSGQLPPAKIMVKEMEVPSQIASAICPMKIGILANNPRMRVMEVVLTLHERVIETSVQENTKGSNSMIQFRPTWSDDPMHGIMSRDEEARVQKGQRQYQKHCDWETLECELMEENRINK
jgi:hypothetical protein